MAQLGEAADSTGTRTSPETAKRVIAAQFRNPEQSPILAGGAVSGTGTLVYHVQAGVGVYGGVSTARYVVWDETDTAVTAPPATGSSTDWIWVDADGVVRLSGAKPATGVILDRRTVPAGCTATTATVSDWDRRYGLSRGSNLGELAYWQENAAPGTAIAADWSASMPFTIPDARGVGVEVCQELHTDQSGDMNPASILWTVRLDGGSAVRFELPVDQRWVLRQHVVLYRRVLPGRHTITVDRHLQWRKNPGAVIKHFGGADGYQVGFYRVRDLGAVQ